MYGRIRAILAIWAKRPGVRRVGFSLALNAVEVFISIAFLIIGIPVLINPSAVAPNSILALLPLWLVYVWGAGMISGGVLKILGVVMVQERIERMGALSMGMTSLVLAIALAPLLPNVLTGFIIYLALATSMIARFWVLGRLLEARRSLERG